MGGAILLNTLGQCFRIKNGFLWCFARKRKSQSNVFTKCRVLLFLFSSHVEWGTVHVSTLETWDLLHIFLTREITFLRQAFGYFSGNHYCVEHCGSNATVSCGGFDFYSNSPPTGPAPNIHTFVHSSSTFILTLAL